MRSLILGLVCSVLLVSPASAHQFLDYFDYGATGLSSRGYQTARDVAAWVARDPAATRVIISAHMDTAEATEFSEELAKARAQGMATELVALGVDPLRIEMRSHAARQLARATPDRTREPLNRRLVVDVKLERLP